MAVSITFNGLIYSIPQVGDESWGESLTSYFVAISQGALQKSGGSFTLTAEVNFGASFGLLSQYYKTRTSNVASAGQFRLARTDVISWRNQANSANLDLGVDSSNNLTFNGGALPTGGITALTGDVTATGPGSVAATVDFVGGVSAANVALGATAANNATSANTVSRIVIRDGSGNFAADTITASLTGVASGNTTITPNQYGVVVSGAANVLGVIAPDASTTKVLVSGGASANPSWQDIATGALALGNFGSSPNAAGAWLSGGTLTLQPADATNPGGVSVSAQTFAGAKTFSSAPVFSSVTASQALIVDSGKALSSIAYVSAPATSTLMLRDSNANVQANAFTPNYSSTATAAGTTTLTVGSSYIQVFTGSTTQTVKLPAANTLSQTGAGFFIINRSSGVVTVVDDGSNTIQAMAANSFCWFTVANIGSANGSWNASYSVNNAGGGTVTSVAFSVPGASIFGVTGSPVTTSGTLGMTTTGTSGGIPYFSSASALSSSALLAQYGVVVGGGAGAAPATIAPDSSTSKVLTSGGSSANPTWSSVQGNATICKVPTVQTFTSGSGTYTLPTSPSPIYIRVRMVGGGGAGAGGGSGAGQGSNGAATTFGTTLLSAGGGFAPASSIANPGLGGTSSLGSGPVGIALAGGMGAPGFNTSSPTLSAGLSGGSGGNSAFGGGGAGGNNNAGLTSGQAGAANTGGGGGGGYTTGNVTGAGGGAGGFVDAIISAPSSTYSYSVGAGGTGGTAGTGGAAGGNGGSGYIIVEEFYQ